MKTRRFPIAAALAALFASTLPWASASAAALGEIASLSAIGAPFRAEFGIASGSAEDLQGCLRVVVPEDAAHDLPWLTGGRISTVGRGSAARIVISSSQVINEPAIRLAIANVCDAQLRREYTALLPYRADPTLPAAAPVAVPREAARTGSVRAARSHATTWSTATGESLASLASALYPDDAAARRRFVRATAAANPELFPDAASQRTELPPGTPVRIPDLRRVAAPSAAVAPEPAQRRPVRAETAPQPARPTAAPAVARASPPTAATASDRVVVAPDRREAAAAAAVPPQGSAAGRRHEDSLNPLRRERDLTEAIDRSIVAEMELLRRIKELEQIQAQLEQRTRAIAALPPVMPPATPTAPQLVNTAGSTNVTDSQPEATPSRAWHDWMLGGGLLLATLLVLAAVSRRRAASEGSAASPQPGRSAGTRRTSPPLTAPPAIAAADTADAAARGTALHSAATTPAGAPADELRIDWESPAHTTRSHPSATVASADMQELAEDHKSAVELADIMMSFGRLQGAADTLAEFIQGNPRQAISPWLKLLDVYRAAGLRGEFDELSRQLNKTFNVRRVSWENYDTLRNTSLSLENMPHIVARLQALWGSRECQAYIQQLLRDNRDGSRQGLPFVVIDDLLVLEGVLEQEFGPYRSYAMKVADAVE